MFTLRGLLTALAIVFIANISVIAQGHEIIIKNGDVNIGGTLVLPATEAKNPLVILISGSGIQDRDETIVGFKPFKVIADSLAGEGIASFRYDDRGTGHSTGVFSDATIDTLVSDIDAVIEYFKNEAPHPFSEFILLGHSQGGIVGTKAAAENKSITSLILMASPMVPLKDVINEQISILNKAMGKSDTDIANTLVFQEQVYEAVRTDEGWDDVKYAFTELFKSEVAKLPEAQRNTINDVDGLANTQYKQQIEPIRTPQMRSLLFYDPAVDLQELKIPVLAIYGGKDIQVSEKQNKPIAEKTCAGANLNCTFKTFPRANHLFQKATTGMPAEYTLLPKSFLDGFTESITEWVLVQSK